MNSRRWTDVWLRKQTESLTVCLLVVVVLTKSVAMSYIQVH